MAVIWYILSAAMVLNGLGMLLLYRYLEGITFIAIGVAFILLRRYRLRRDRNKTFE